jgi:co-chaperonin GroES (HSP10)
MDNFIKVLKGKRLLVEKPAKPESQVLLSEEAEASMEKEMMVKWSKLRVATIGDEVTSIKEGDLVYIGTNLKHCELIEINDKHYFIVAESAVIAIW